MLAGLNFYDSIFIEIQFTILHLSIILLTFRLNAKRKGTRIRIHLLLGSENSRERLNLVVFSSLLPFHQAKRL